MYTTRSSSVSSEIAPTIASICIPSLESKAYTTEKAFARSIAGSRVQQGALSTITLRRWLQSPPTGVDLWDS
jgi:hypothetical protein